MSTTSTAPQHTDSAGSRPLAGRLAAAAGAAAVLNVLLALVLRAATGTSGDFLPLQPGPVAVATVVGVLAGALVFLLLRRFLRRPEPVFIGLVLAGTALSLAGPLSMLGASPADQPGVTDTAALSLLPLHVVPAVAVLVAVLAGRHTGVSRRAAR
jgi:hypothetical protein